MGRELPPSFKPGSGANEQAKLAALRYQGATSVIPGSGRGAYEGPQSGNWQYCQKLPPEASGQARVVSGHAVDGFSRSPQKPVIVVGPGEQFGQRTLKAPEGSQGGRVEAGHEKNGRIKEFVRRGLGAAAAIAVAVGGMFGVGHAAEVVKANTTEVTCQEFEIGSPESVPGMPGTVVMNKEDQRRVGGFFKEVGGDASAASMTSPQLVDVFRGGATTVCVRTNAIDGVSDVSVTHTGK